MDRKLIEEFDRKQRSQKRKHKRSSNSAGLKSKQNKVEEPEFVQPSTSYRDRARERREGLNKDFELDPDDLLISNPTIANELSNDKVTEDENEIRQQQIEDSKYLGGDIEHTHLVKGLDFALLEKVKNDQKLAEKLSSDRDADRDMSYDSDSDEEEFRNEAIMASVLNSSSTSNPNRQMVDLEKLRKGQSTEIVQCKTALARRILNVLDEKWPDRSDLFLPGRMKYSISLEDEGEDHPVATIIKSKADTTIHDEVGSINESDFALDQLVSILAKVRKGDSHSSEATKRSRSWDAEDDMNDYGY